MSFTIDSTKDTTPSNIGVVSPFAGKEFGSVTMVIRQVHADYTGFMYGPTKRSSVFENTVYGSEITEDMKTMEIGEMVEVEIYGRVVNCYVSSKQMNMINDVWCLHYELETH